MRRLAPIILLLFVAAGCGRSGEGPRTESVRVTAQPATATVAADMCAEHGVLEAICTACHPNLVPIFKDKGDWCVEHEFPESVCPTCHPERGGRPVNDVTMDGAPVNGTVVRFKTMETARQAGIEVFRAMESPGGAGITATATIVADAAHHAVVNARSSGVVRSIRVDVGSVVRRGAPLATVESAEVGQERSRLQSARARMQVAEASFNREKELHDKGISSQREVELARQEAQTAAAEMNGATAALRMMGAGGGSSGTYVLAAPISGIVSRRSATVGTMVDREEELFEIVDTSSLWADLDVPESDAPRVAPGQRVALRLEGLPDREFYGTIHSVSPSIDPRTRTVRARAKLSGGDAALRANSYAKARILTDPTQAAVTVPRSAIQEAKGVSLAFVRMAEDRYEARRVQLAASAGDHVTLAGGVAPGEYVATVGSFLLKTETMKEGIGAGCCEVEAPKR